MKQSAKAKQNPNPIDLIEYEIPHLRRFARKLTRNSDTADDLVQTALLRAVDKIHQWQAGTNMRAWLFTILRNSFYNDCRKLKHERETINGYVSSEDVAAVNASQECAGALGEVEVAFDQLTLEHREVLLVVAVDGMKYEDAARVLGVPVGTVRSRLSRARRALQDVLDGDSPVRALRSAPIKPTRQSDLPPIQRNENLLSTNSI